MAETIEYREYRPCSKLDDIEPDGFGPSSEWKFIPATEAPFGKVFTLGFYAAAAATCVIPGVIDDVNPITKQIEWICDNEGCRLAGNVEERDLAKKSFSFIVTELLENYGLSVTDAAFILSVQRPTIYTWRKDTTIAIKSEHQSRLLRVAKIFDLVSTDGPVPNRIYHLRDHAGHRILDYLLDVDVPIEIVADSINKKYSNHLNRQEPIVASDLNQRVKVEGRKSFPEDRA